jgi:hypothetical protein
MTPDPPRQYSRISLKIKNNYCSWLMGIVSD